MPAGRPRKPTEILKLSTAHKNIVDNRRDSKQVAYNKDTKLDPPKHLLKKTKEAWEMTIPILINQQIIGPLDLPTLVLGFESLDESYRALTTIKKYDKVHDISEANYVTNRRKLSQWYSNSLGDVIKIFSRFGITPEARAHLNIGEKQENKEADPLDVVLGEITNG